MADNSVRTPGTGENIATDELTYSGDTAKVQLVRLVHVAGAEGAKTLSEIADATNGIDVDVTRVQGSVAVTNAGTFATQVDGAALTALQLIDDPVFADDAAFTVGTSKVTMAGAVAVAHGSNPDAADANDAAALLVNRHRILYTIGGHPNIVSAEYYTTGAQTDDNVVAVVSAGTKIVVTGISVACSAANTVNVDVRIGFGATTLTARGATGADGVTKIILSHPGIPPGGGMMKGGAGGIIGIGADGDDLRITCTAPTSGSLTVQVDYFTIES